MFIIGKCFSDPETCKGKGLTVITSLKLDQSTLSKGSSSYIMSSGGQTTKARGFALVHINNQYVLILGTKTKQWMIKTPTLPSDWFKLAFTWHNDGDLKLYINGKMVSSAKGSQVARPKDAFTTLTMGRPNNSNTNKYRLGLEVDSVGLWETALSEEEISNIMKSGEGNIVRTIESKSEREGKNYTEYRFYPEMHFYLYQSLIL